MIEMNKADQKIHCELLTCWGHSHTWVFVNSSTYTWSIPIRVASADGKSVTITIFFYLPFSVSLNSFTVQESRCKNDFRVRGDPRSRAQTITSFTHGISSKNNISPSEILVHYSRRSAGIRSSYSQPSHSTAALPCRH
jgi:hypothetical protein